MSQLIVVAEATQGSIITQATGAGGHAGTPILAVSVTKADGTPLKNLGKSNFAVHFLAGDQFDSKFLGVTLAVVHEQVPGVYVIAPAEFPTVAPKTAGQKNIYAVAVTSGARGTQDRGQTLTTLRGK